MTNWKSPFSHLLQSALVGLEELGQVDLLDQFVGRELAHLLLAQLGPVGRQEVVEEAAQPAGQLVHLAGRTATRLVLLGRRGMTGTGADSVR